jgi:hypothetical protein
MDDVGHAYDRCMDDRRQFEMTLGVHPNDQMFSFYVRTLRASTWSSAGVAWSLMSRPGRSSTWITSVAGDTATPRL